MQEDQLYKRLVQRYLDNTASQEELAVFFDLLQQGKLDAYLEGLPLEPAQELNHRKAAFRIRKPYRLAGYVAAASLLVAVLSVAVFYSKPSHTAALPTAAVTSLVKAAPGSSRAVLTLSNGKTVVLDKSRQTITDGNASIVQKDETLVYESEKESMASLYNTVTTPRGGEYKITLPDGTAVWLNAGTSLRYPIAFAAAERRVELSGEAYFEVAKDAAKPFLVQAADAEVKVLGTHFNVKAYADESAMKTALAEGSVALRKDGIEKKLIPGEGGTIEKASDNIKVSATDLEGDLAWHNGVFYFQKTALSDIMRQLARWYDIEVRYAGAVPDKRFVGRIGRYTNLSEVLDVLRASGLRFSMQGRLLTVE